MKFRALRADEIDCRIQSLSETKKGVGAVLLLYKDARVDMNILDETVGALNWKRSHELIGDRLYCTISIRDKNNEWVSKQDVGTESNTEKEKGQASDSFKRAGFNWGIGRELYSAPFIYIKLRDDEVFKDKNGKLKTYSKFKVSDIEYDENKNIILLVIGDNNDERFVYGKKTIYNQPQRREPQKKPVDPNAKIKHEIVEIVKQKGILPADVTKHIATTFKKPKLDLLDGFELVAMKDWAENHEVVN